MTVDVSVWPGCNEMESGVCIDLNPDLQNTSMCSALRASTGLFTKTDGFSFEHHVFCDGPEGESQGCDE